MTTCVKSRHNSGGLIHLRPADCMRWQAYHRMVCGRWLLGRLLTHYDEPPPDAELCPKCQATQKREIATEIVTTTEREDGVLYRPQAIRVITAAIQAATVAAAKKACEAVREACTKCDTRGVGGRDAGGNAIECEYCGRPIAAIHAAFEEKR